MAITSHPTTNYNAIDKRLFIIYQPITLYTEFRIESSLMFPMISLHLVYKTSFPSLLFDSLSLIFAKLHYVLFPQHSTLLLFFLSNIHANFEHCRTALCENLHRLSVHWTWQWQSQSHEQEGQEIIVVLICIYINWSKFSLCTLWRHISTYS